MHKYELHAQTSNCDLCAKLSGDALVRAYHEAGYSGIVITDHYFSLFFDWFENELSGLCHKGIIDRYLHGYYSAKNEGEKLGFDVLCGAEVRLPDTINDYLLYGMQEKDFYELPLLCRLQNLKELRAALPEYVLIVQAHPFRNAMTVTDPSPLFGIEVYNGGTEEYRNAMALDFAKHYGKAMTSGSDCHKQSAVAMGGILTDARISSPTALTEVLRSGKYSLIKPM